jgi:hypothetical protein
MNKIITINGKHNIEKITKIKSEREILKKLNLEDYLFIHKNQVELLNSFFLGEKCNYENQLLREIKNKLNSYKSQDKIKNCLDTRFFISLNNIIELLVKSKLKCYYCRDNVFILYRNVRENKQWTLDRIDNDEGHNTNNCVIACLLCNIQRKTLDDNKFKFTKQLIIIKN